MRALCSAGTGTGRWARIGVSASPGWMLVMRMPLGRRFVPDVPSPAMSSHPEHFDGNDFLDGMIAGDHVVDGVESRGVKVPFPALHADLGIHILHKVELAFEPMLLPDRLGHGIGIAELTLHLYSFLAYTVMTTSASISEKRQITFIVRPSFAVPSIR